MKPKSDAMRIYEEKRVFSSDLEGVAISFIGSDQFGEALKGIFLVRYVEDDSLQVIDHNEERHTISMENVRDGEFEVLLPTNYLDVFDI